MPDDSRHDRQLQTDLQAAVRTLSFARAEKRDASLMAVGCSVATCIGAVAGLGLLSCGAGAGVIGVAIIAAAVLTLGRLASTFDGAAESMPKAEKQIRDVGGRIRGGESLSVDALDRDNLHYLLKSGGPQVAIAVIRILGVVGDRRSLGLIEAIVAREGFSSGIATSFDVGVREAAEAAVKPLRDRLNRYNQTARLLRPSNASAGSELLRPAQDEAGVAPEHLLRVEPDEEASAD